MSWAAQQYALGCPDLLPTSVIAGWTWCRSLEEDAKFDEEIAELLAGANGDPNIIEQRVCVLATLPFICRHPLACLVTASPCRSALPLAKHAHPLCRWRRA